MSRDVCEHFTPVDLPCDRCHADELMVAYMMGAHSKFRPLTDEVIADLWYKSDKQHHKFAREIEKWMCTR